MRKLIYFVTLLAAFYGGYWFIGAIALEAGLGIWLKDQSAIGVEFSTLKTRGFPNRFDTTITDLDLREPKGSNRWAIPVMRIYALSYRPNHIIAAWPNAQQLTFAGENMRIDSDEMKGSVVFKPDTTLPLERSSFVASNLQISANSGWRATLDKGTLATRLTATKPLFHDLAVELHGLTPTRQALEMIDPNQQLPAKIDALIVDATLGFDAPWDRFSFGKTLPTLTDLNLKHLTLRWGSVEIRLSGELETDARGYPLGTLDVTASDWPKMFRIARAAGFIDPTFEQPVNSALQALALTSDNPEAIETTLRFSDGKISIGLISLGPAPHLAPSLAQRQ